MSCGLRCDQILEEEPELVTQLQDNAHFMHDGIGDISGLEVGAHGQFRSSVCSVLLPTLSCTLLTLILRRLVNRMVTLLAVCLQVKSERGSPILHVRVHSKLQLSRSVTTPRYSLEK